MADTTDYWASEFGVESISDRLGVFIQQVHMAVPNIPKEAFAAALELTMQALMHKPGWPEFMQEGSEYKWRPSQDLPYIKIGEILAQMNERMEAAKNSAPTHGSA